MAAHVDSLLDFGLDVGKRKEKVNLSLESSQDFYFQCMRTTCPPLRCKYPTLESMERAGTKRNNVLYA